MATDRQRQDLLGTPAKVEYHPTFVPRVHDLCLLGMTKQEIAKALFITPTTLDIWINTYPELALAWLDGTEHADAKVAAAFYKSATGYSHEISNVTDEKGVTTKNYAHVKPSVTACTRWLAVRRPEKWGALINSGQTQVADGTPPAGALATDAEVARKIAYLLAKEIYNKISENTTTINGRSINHDS